jgi:hypothetical protein
VPLTLPANAGRAATRRASPGYLIVSWQIDREHDRVSPLMPDGTVGKMWNYANFFSVSWTRPAAPEALLWLNYAI